MNHTSVWLKPFCRSAAGFGAAMCIAVAASVGDGARSEPAATRDYCREITDLATRTRCYELAKALKSQTPLPSDRTELPNGWNLVRTPNPNGGDLISVTRTADFHKSDPMLAGMTLRCSDGGIEMLLAVLQPYPPRTKLNITIRVGDAPSSAYSAGVVPPGALVRLQDEAAATIIARASRAGELHVELSDGRQAAVSGVIGLDGFSQAFELLKSFCMVR